jgi:hypothetical protein
MEIIPVILSNLLLAVYKDIFPNTLTLKALEYLPHLIEELLHPVKTDDGVHNSQPDPLSGIKKRGSR